MLTLNKNNIFRTILVIILTLIAFIIMTTIGEAILELGRLVGTFIREIFNKVVC